MADFAIYWKNFSRDRRRYGFGPTKPLPDWRTNSERLSAHLQPGDRLWFFAAGEACGGEEPTAGYLVNFFVVQSVVENKGDDPGYPREEFRFTVWSEPGNRAWVSPPLLADRLVRPAGHRVEIHIGGLLQGPRRLSDDKVASLESLVGVARAGGRVAVSPEPGGA